jgi:hypothetical protein
MNENNLPGDVIGVGSSIAPEGMEKRIQILDSVNAKHINADGVLDHDGAWKELLTQELPDITEFFRHTVTLRMDSEYTAFTDLKNGKSPDVNPPDILTATCNSKSVDIPVTFWSLADGSGLGFWLDTDGTRSWHVLRSKSWSGYVVDTQQLSLELGERFTDDQITAAKVPMDIHLAGEHESGFTLFSKVTLDGITARNNMLDVIPAQELEKPSSLVNGNITRYRNDFISDTALLEVFKSIQSGGSADMQKHRDIDSGLYRRNDVTVAILDGTVSGFITGNDYVTRSKRDADSMVTLIGQHFVMYLRAVHMESPLQSDRAVSIPIDFLAEHIDPNYESLTRAKKSDLHIRTYNILRALSDRHISVAKGYRERSGGRTAEYREILQPWFSYAGVEVDAYKTPMAIYFRPADYVVSYLAGTQLKYYITDGLKVFSQIRSRGQAAGNWAIQITSFLQETTRRNASKIAGSKSVTATRWQFITEYPGDPDPITMKAGGKNRSRIREYYCDALRILVESGVLLPDGDAGSMDGHLNANLEYEAITGIRNKIDEWLKQTVTLYVTDNLDPQNVLSAIGERSERRSVSRKVKKPRKRTP